MTRGRLRIYLGAAPGVGKTFAMLNEGHRRAVRGTDVVVGFVATHDREGIRALLEGLERVPDRTPAGSGEFDLAALLTRAPQVALIDELAHENAPGMGHDKRWEDVDVVLAAGIDVVTTLNIEQLESLTDIVEQITGRVQLETIPDSVVRRADQIELVDMAPEALQRRLAHGNVYPGQPLDAELSNYFRIGNLTALRELTLLWLADRVDEGLQRYRSEHGIEDRWETRERVVVGLTGDSRDELIIRRAARIAARTTGGDLLAVHVAKWSGLSSAAPDALAQQRRLVETLGGTYHQLVGADVAATLLEFARAENATQLVLGDRPRNGLWRAIQPGVGQDVLRHSGEIDVHLVSQSENRSDSVSRQRFGNIGRDRTIAAFVLSIILPVLLTIVLTQTRTVINRQSDLLLFLLVIVVTALVGGLRPALAAAAMSFFLVNYWFIEPQYTFRIQDRNSVLAVVVFLLVAVLVSAVVDLASRRTREAAIATAEAETLSTVAGSVLRGDTALDAIFDRFREAFGITSIALLESDSEGGWSTLVSAGPEPPTGPSDGDLEVLVGQRYALVGRGLPAAPHQRRVFVGFAAQAAVAIEQQRLVTEAAVVVELEAADRLRTALLAALGHDLRTPLAAAKASVDSLRDYRVPWTEEQRADLLETADSSLDRLARLVDNLLDLSRLQAGVMPVLDEVVDLGEVIALALTEVDSLPIGRLAGPADDIAVKLPADLPDVQADTALLERVIANLLANAVRHSPPDKPPWLVAASRGETVELQVVDRGPGIALPDRDRVFAPFQRLGDTDNTSGVGLGLALSRGLAEAMGASISLEDTPGGGLTAVLLLRRAATSSVPPPGRRELTDPGTPA